MKPALEINNLSKKYTIQHLPGGYLSFRERIANGFRFNVLNEENFFALEDISFKVGKGESIGIIGRNGAGKSTLLKILSRITPPTKGKIITRGRIASLLEVGTGFHPELTGRENIFFNGALLGMKRVEIKQRFSEIVDFSGTERFLDTPLKHFSSGMQLRLAFAVAAFLESEVLIIDEVLAVGDAQFQKKCLNKMEDVTKQEGRTILFVSHNLNSVLNLCPKSVLLQNGRLVSFDDTDKVISKYLYEVDSEKHFVRTSPCEKQIALASAEIQSETGDFVYLKLDVFSRKKSSCSIDLRFTDNLSNPIGFASLGGLNLNEMVNLFPGNNYFMIEVDISRLAVGHYNLHIDLTMPNIEYYDRVQDCLRFEVIRKSNDPSDRLLAQAWNYGSYEVPLKLVK
jgi:lipopolysaccharide transport system ATP-binding protein